MVKEDENRSWNIVINPISGCKYNCKYCYMDKYNIDMTPKFDKNELARLQMMQQPQRVFVGGAGDAWGHFIKAEWIRQVLEAVKKEQHRHDFMFITKNPHRYKEFELPENAWYGTTYDGTAVTQANIDRLKESVSFHRFVSFEPLQANPKNVNLDGISWIIIGADLNKGAKKPPVAWARRLVKEAKLRGIPVWINDSYNYPEKLKEYPVEFVSEQLKVYHLNGYIIKLRKDCGLLHLSISRKDGKCIHDWRKMQEIKNCIVGHEREAVEVYPAESRVLDARNSFHLWVFPEGYKIPFGFNGRLVMEGERQRPFGNLKTNVVSIEEVKRRVAEESNIGLD